MRICGKAYPLEVKNIYAKEKYSCIVDFNNLVRCWGDNIFFQQGYNSLTNSLLPTKISVINNFEIIESCEDSL